MSKKIINIIFISIFIFIIFVPLFFTNLKPNTMSKSEKRYLVKPAQLYTQDGNLNTHFIKDFENWFNDNMGFRSYLVTMNANIQFYLFDRIERKDMHLGPNKELNYATDAILKDYQHNNLKSEDELNEIASSFQIINDYLKSKNIQYYYVQCFDKHSIYPEYFSNHVNQYGDISKTDQIMKKLSDSTNISFISMKDILKNEKENYEVYSKWGDPTHWSQRGLILDIFL